MPKDSNLFPEKLFHLRNIVENFEYDGKNVTNNCYTVGKPISGMSPSDSSVLPRDDCLILSIANIFGTKENFDHYSDPMSTVWEWNSVWFILQEKKR